MAKEFSIRERTILCGDAAHTHSSVAAQGLNTAVHDAVNLGWKLALQTRGITKPEILQTYNEERKLAPKWYEGDPTADPYVILGEISEKAGSFNIGLEFPIP
ncbi:uncharacterized protein BHQ10_010062 [Talaromyces amestolkiae]|uniref:FAD-binding domain-containing protein n=1 Tax=Talaromyces amestolkiae TaxID=1196081 RepID=A0A364LE03_TALAM|nr:uncharacterized protein BHQ10_010062 [Talaromyces amestolkiae]RAO74050.1 hypothetical protein BHQ10_010062 [Talaromyces amestolkiae]